MLKPRHFDACLIGQGLAGTTLAWTLLLRGQRCLLIDRGEAVTASRIAAGLLTPVTGPKLATTLYWNECRTLAESFYRRIEQLTGTVLFESHPALHLFRSEDEQQRFQLRWSSQEFQRITRPLDPSEIPATMIAPWGGFEMPTAGRLHVARYLDVSREYFQKADSFLQADIDAASDIRFDEDGITLPQLHVSADRLIFCQGFPPQTNGWFDTVRFQPAKGEILTLKIDGLQETRAIHADNWLAPMPDNTFLSGSTFEWKELDSHPTAAARELLLTRLQRWLKCTVNVIDQRGAVRPTMHDFQPVIGLHPELPRLGILNGLGTKGSLMAPWLAEQLADHMDHQSPLPRELDVRRWFR
ncbi:NAD(P)/FAD-dependent oxidoreductase [Planctomicrobium sp. SH661]|uniref:NAD(P)/FAD-dependent oxidoreductase n=1 Tax=Planctomicrobium sp. SH661 TaxID=3448124 RepID=UPI003F5BC41C